MHGGKRTNLKKWECMGTGGVFMESSKKVLRILCFLGIAFLLGNTSVNAAEVTMHFSGIVTSTGANSVALSEVRVGDRVTGKYTFNTVSPDEMSSDSNTGLYKANSLTLQVKGFSYRAADNKISVVNNGMLIPGQPVFDVYEVVSPLRNVSGPALSGLPPAQIDLVIVDRDATVFSDDSLPASLDIREFEIVSEMPLGTTGGRVIFQSLASGGIGEIRFKIISLSVAK
jgi:hypothetical protein